MYTILVAVHSRQTKDPGCVSSIVCTVTHTRDDIISIFPRMR